MSVLPLDAPPVPPPAGPRPAHALGPLLIAILLPLAVVALLHVSTQRRDATVPEGILTLSQAERFDVDRATPPAGEGRPQRLPLLEPHRRDAAGSPIWLRVPFVLAEDAKTPWLFAVGFRPSVVVYLDGELLAQSAAGTGVSGGVRGFQLGNRALEVPLPPSVLRAGPHELWIRLGLGSYDGAAISSVRLGPSDAMEEFSAGRGFMLLVRGAVAVAAVVLGLFLVFAWAALRQESTYGLAGVQCLLIALLLSPHLLAEAPLPAPWWRVTLDIADVGAKGLLLLLVVRLFDAGPPWVAKLAIAYLAVGTAVDGLAAYAGYAWTDFSQPWPWWALASRALVLGLGVALLARAVWRHGGRRRLVAAAVVGLAAWAWAYVSFFILVVPGRLPVSDLNYAGYGAWVLLLGALLQSRYVASLRREQLAREDLERQVRERTAQLEANFEALRESERLRMAASERERLLQEMHDGLGAQLLMAKLNAQRGTLTQVQMVQSCDDCIQEMRLAVDGLSVADGDLGLLLANLRHRFGERLRTAGIDLEWSVGDTPLVPSLRGTGGPDLVRIVQEALNNVLHHAKARKIRIETGLDGADAVYLAVDDDGEGMAPGASEGRGLRNIRARAARLGASVAWLPAPGGRGTRLLLTLPLAIPVGR